MARDIKHAARALQEFFERAVENEIREASIEIFNEVVKGTPVDTGRARNNWQISTNRIPTSETSSNTISLQVKDKDDTVYVVNNTPYIVALNNGHSPQAQAKFIEHGIAVVESKRSR